MTTVRDALGEGAKALRKSAATWADGAQDAELLLAHALATTKKDLYVRNERTVPAAALRRYRSLLARRAKREPVAYLLGRKEFFGLPFFVDKRVLIPRPETETLVERALKLLKGVGSRESGVAGRNDSPLPTPDSLIFDIGTGSGAIAIAVAKNAPTVRLVATDSSASALAVARRNAKALGVTHRISFKKADLLPDDSRLPTPYSLILANLPYVPTAEWRTLAPDVRRYEPRAALDGGRDGLAAYRRLLDALKERGIAAFTLLAEIHPEQAAPLRAEVRRRWPRAAIALHEDLAGKTRVIEIAVA